MVVLSAVSPVDPWILLIATVIADVIVAGGWFLTLIPLVLLLRSRRNELLSRLPEGAKEEPEGAVRWLLYAVSLMFWPAAIGLSAYFLTKPETARAGVVCAYLFLVYVSASVAVAIGIVTAAAVLAPQWFGYFL